MTVSRVTSGEGAVTGERVSIRHTPVTAPEHPASTPKEKPMDAMEAKLRDKIRQLRDAGGEFVEQASEPTTIKHQTACMVMAHICRMAADITQFGEAKPYDDMIELIATYGSGDDIGYGWTDE